MIRYLLFSVIPFLLILSFSCNSRKLNDNSKIGTKKHSPKKERNKPTVEAKNTIPVEGGKLNSSEVIEVLFAQLKPGSILNIPEGNYLVSTPLLIDASNVVISGVKGKTKLVFDNSNDWYKHYGKRVGMINIVSNGVTIKDLELDHNFRKSGRKDGDTPLIGGIIIGGKYLGRAKKTSNITIEDCRVYDYYGDAISIFNAQSDDFKVINNHLISSYIVGGWKTAGVKGEQAISISSGTRVTIENNIIEGALDDAIATHIRTNQLVIKNNEITTTGGRILINGVHDGLVEDNTITYIQDGDSGIDVSYEWRAKKLNLNNKIVINNNTIKIKKGVRIRKAISLHGCGRDIMVSNNKIVSENGEGSGIWISDRIYPKNGNYYLGKNITLKENQIRGFKIGINKKINDPKNSNSNISATANDLESLEVGTNLTTHEIKENKVSKISKYSHKPAKAQARIQRIPNKNLSRSSESISLTSFLPNKKNKKRGSFFFILETPQTLKYIKLNTIKDFVRIDFFDVNKKQKVGFVTKKDGFNNINLALSAKVEYRVTVTSKTNLPDSLNLELKF